LTRSVYQLSGKSSFARDFGLRDQIRRASVSVMANIAEGFGRHSDKEFANFLNVVHGSAAETQSHLYVALDLGYIDEATFTAVYSLPRRSLAYDVSASTASSCRLKDQDFATLKTLKTLRTLKTNP